VVSPLARARFFYGTRIVRPFPGPHPCASQAYIIIRYALRWRRQIEAPRSPPISSLCVLCAFLRVLCVRFFWFGSWCRRSGRECQIRGEDDVSRLSRALSFYGTRIVRPFPGPHPSGSVLRTPRQIVPDDLFEPDCLLVYWGNSGIRSLVGPLAGALVA